MWSFGYTGENWLKPHYHSRQQFFLYNNEINIQQIKHGFDGNMTVYGLGGPS